MSSKTTKKHYSENTIVYIYKLPFENGTWKKTSKKVLEVSIVTYYMCVFYTYIDGISSMH